MKYMFNKQDHNLHHRLYAFEDAAGPFGIPIIRPVHARDLDLSALEWIGFNYAKSTPAVLRGSKGLHFFVDDYQFERVWRTPLAYVGMLQQFGAVLSPDFSPYADWPPAVQHYNHYRKHWLGRYWQDQGIVVVPTITWSSPDTLDWAFDGEPRGGVVALSATGMHKNQLGIDWLMEGYQAMMARLEPELILWRGRVPEEIQRVDGGRILKLPNYADKFDRMREERKAAEAALAGREAAADG